MVKVKIILDLPSLLGVFDLDKDIPEDVMPSAIYYTQEPAEVVLEYAFDEDEIKYDGIRVQLDFSDWKSKNVRFQKIEYPRAAPIEAMFYGGDGQKLVKNGTSVGESENSQDAVNADDT